MRGQNPWLPYVLVGPIVIGMLGLVYYPIAVTLWYSVHAMNLVTPWIRGFVGLRNYWDVVTDPSIGQAALNSLYVVVVVLLQTVLLGIAMALILNRDTRFKGALMAIAIVPWALPPVVNGILWRWVFHPDFGLVNSLLQRAGWIDSPINWLTDRFLVLTVTGLVLTWRSVPLAALIFLSTIQTIPHQLYEAARIDGASAWSQFRLVTLPLLRPALGIVLTTTSIAAANVFDEVVSLSGFAAGTRTIMIETYLRTFRSLDFGQGSALVYLVMLATGVAGILYVRRVYRTVQYL